MKPKNLSFSPRNLLKKIIDFGEKFSFITLIFLTLITLSIGEIIFEMNSPPVTYDFISLSDDNIYAFRLKPLKSGESRELYSKLTLARGKRAFFNFTTTYRTSIELIPYIFDNDDKIFTADPIHISMNKTHHLFELPSSDHYIVYKILLTNLFNQENDFEGYITISGFNHDFILIPVLLIVCYGTILISRFILPKTINLSKNIKYKTKTLASYFDICSEHTSSLFRIQSILKLQKHEFNQMRLIIITLLAWFIIEPMITFQVIVYSIFSMNPLVSESIEISLIEPYNSYFLLLVILISFETSEFIATRISRRDILTSMSLPVKRSEWIFGTFLWIFSLYGGIFTIIIIIKAFLIYLQSGLFLIWILSTEWLFLFLLILAAWISTGLLTSSTSKTKLVAMLKYLIVIVIMMILFNANSLWPSMTDLENHIVFVGFLTQLSLLSTIIGIWFLLSTIALCNAVQKLQIS